MVRGGAVLTIPAEQLVVGDIVNIKSGDKVPADCRLIFNQGLKIDQVLLSSLTHSRTQHFVNNYMCGHVYIRA